MVVGVDAVDAGQGGGEVSKQNPPPVIAIDPGPTECGVCTWNDAVGMNPGTEVMSTKDCIDSIREDWPLIWPSCHIAIERIQHYGSGMAVGKSVFDTVFWYGRMVEAFGDDTRVHFFTRPQIKTQICGSAKAKDTNIRQALIDRFGGSRQAAVGTKKNPGPLYGIKSHAWSALAVAVTFRETWTGKAGR